MGQLKKKAKRRRPEEEKGVTRSPNWSDLHPDLLRCIFERLSFTSLNRSKLICSSWYCASKGYFRNQNPWLIIFPSRRKKKKNRCMFFVPEDEKVYTSKELGLEFARSHCVMTCGNWFLMNNVECQLCIPLYILNPVTGERIDLPDIRTYNFMSKGVRFCFWIDNNTKDYLVVMAWPIMKFIKKGYNRWNNLGDRWVEEAFYNDKNQKLYLREHTNLVSIWDFSGDIPSLDGSVSYPRFHCEIKNFPWEMKDLRMVTTVSGEFLMVSSTKHRWQSTWLFHIYKRNEVDNQWVEIDSLGDEALIYEMSITFIANRNIPGIKRNSIYFSSGPDNILFVYDITTQQVEPLPQCFLSSIPSLIRGRWFFPC